VFYMLKAVKEFVDACGDHGLCIIDRPTGDGKTYDAMQYIHEHYKENQKFFYITPLKKNVEDAMKQCREIFAESNEAEEFDSRALILKPNCEPLIEHFEEIEDDLRQDFDKSETFRQLTRIVPSLRKMKERLDNGSEDPNVDWGLYQNVLKTVSEQYEPAFREEIGNWINKKCKTVNGRIDYITAHCPYLTKIYPAILTSKRQIFFMSVDKFYLGNNPIVEKSYRFIGNSIVKGALVFIDEFDATKEDLLKQMITESKRSGIDVYSLYSQIHNALTTKKMPKNLFCLKSETKHKYKSDAVYDKLKMVFQENYEKYHLDKFFKYQRKEGADPCMLFEDYHLSTINVGDKAKYVKVAENKEMVVNDITETEEENAAGNDIFYTINAIDSSITLFEKSVSIIATNFMEWRNSLPAKPNEDKMELDAAISSVLRCFDLDRNFKDYISRNIINRYANIAENDKPGMFEDDFYDSGFRYFSFLDDIHNDLTTEIHMVALATTPEHFMVTLANKALVVGLSATGNIKSVIGNYDLNYLKAKLEHYYTFNEETKERIYQAFIEKESGITSEITSEEIKSNYGDDDSDVDVLSALFPDEEYREKAKEIIESCHATEFNINRFLKVFQSIVNFCKNKRSSAMLVLTNRNIKTDDTDLYSIPKVRELLNLYKNNGHFDFVDPYFFPLFGQNYYRNNLLYRVALENKHRVVLISSYPSVGTGQNLQYEVSDEDTKETVIKDLDSIYLEKPTNILVNTTNDIAVEDLIKLIYQAKTLSKNGEISDKKAKEIIRNGFKKILGKSGYVRESEATYATDSVNNNIVKLLVQAVGRISRVKNKDYPLHLYIDEDIFSSVDFSCMDSLPKNKEFDAFYSSARRRTQVEVETSENKRLLNTGNHNDQMCRLKIHKYLSDNSRGWSQDQMKEWQDLRAFVLQHPTIDEATLLANPKYTELYVHAPEGKKISVLYKSRDEDIDCPLSYRPFESKNYEVSAKSARLEAMLKSKDVSDLFAEKHFATEFFPNDYILGPTAFNDIYKGALGEEVGARLLEHISCGVSPIDEPEAFEKFDFYCNSNPDVYVDFKNWSDLAPYVNDDLTADKVISKSLSKLEEIHGKRAIIINIVGDSACESRIVGDGRLLIIPAFLYLNNGLCSIRVPTDKILTFLD
jgi:hypothetical protein